MKKLLILAAVSILGAVNMMAQSQIVVNTETIFKAIPEYATAVEEIDKQAQQYQTNIDKAYEQIEVLYNRYMEEKASMNQNQQQMREESILTNEQKIADYQEDVFGAEGIIEKQKAEKLEPIQKRVMETISKYAKDNKHSLVLDVATNPMVIYYTPEMDKTQQIILLLK